MRILFFSDNYPPEVNAAATRVHERACLWVRDGHAVTVITSAPNFPQGRIYSGYRNRLRQVEVIDGVRVVRVWSFITGNEGIGLRIFDFLSYMVSSFIAAFFEPRPHLITSTSPQFFCAVGAWAHAAVRRLPYVFELGDLWPASITALGAMRPGRFLRIMERLELFLYRRADAVVALTADFKRDLISRGIPAKKIEVVRNGVDLSRYGPRPRDAALATEWNLTEKFTVAYVGTHGLAHALENVLEAARLLENRAPEVRFLFVGDGAARNGLVARAAEISLTNVVFVGPRPKEEMPSWWSLADAALIHLKKVDLFAGVIPSKIFEAMGMGVPILFAGPRGEASEIISQEGCGLIVAPEEPEALAEAIVQLMSDRALLAQLRSCSINAAARHSRAHQADRMIAIYRAVLEGDYRQPRISSVKEGP